MRTVLLACQHIRQFHTITNQFAEMANSWRRDKGRLDHAAHEQVTDPSGIPAVGLVSFLGFGVLRMCQSNLTGLLQGIEHRNPVLAGRLHANFLALVLLKPGSQSP